MRKSDPERNRRALLAICCLTAWVGAEAGPLLAAPARVPESCCCCGSGPCDCGCLPENEDPDGSNGLQDCSCGDLPAPWAPGQRTGPQRLQPCGLASLDAEHEPSSAPAGRELPAAPLEPPALSHLHTVVLLI